MGDEVALGLADPVCTCSSFSGTVWLIGQNIPGLKACIPPYSELLGRNQSSTPSQFQQIPHSLHLLHWYIAAFGHGSFLDNWNQLPDRIFVLEGHFIGMSAR